MRPSELSTAFIDAHNRRDTAAMRAMLDPDIEYLRPGDIRRDGIDAIMAAYEREWARHDALVHVRESVEQDDCFAAEIEVHTAGKTLRGSVFHRWREGKLVYYRAYFDPSV